MCAKYVQDIENISPSKLYVYSWIWYEAKKKKLIIYLENFYILNGVKLTPRRVKHDKQKQFCKLANLLYWQWASVRLTCCCLLFQWIQMWQATTDIIIIITHMERTPKWTADPSHMGGWQEPSGSWYCLVSRCSWTCNGSCVAAWHLKDFKPSRNERAKRRTLRAPVCVGAAFPHSAGHRVEANTNNCVDPYGTLMYC